MFCFIPVQPIQIFSDNLQQTIVFNIRMDKIPIFFRDQFLHPSVRGLKKKEYMMNKIRQQEAVTSTCNEAERARVNDLRNCYHHHHHHRYHHQYAAISSTTSFLIIITITITIVTITIVIMTIIIVIIANMHHYRPSTTSFLSSSPLSMTGWTFDVRGAVAKCDVLVVCLVGWLFMSVKMMTQMDKKVCTKGIIDD